MELLKLFLSCFLAASIVLFFWVFFPVIIENFFHPRHRQRLRHAKKEWDHATVEIPYKSTSRDKTVWFERNVKYSEERGEYFIRNGNPYCNGARWEPDWVEVTSDNIKQVIKRQL